MIFSNCPKLFVTNKSVVLTSFLNVNPNLVDGSFFLTFAEQNKIPKAGKNEKTVSIFLLLLLAGLLFYRQRNSLDPFIINVSTLTTQMEGQRPSPGTHPLHFCYWG
jgi:hypothetical protein